MSNLSSIIRECIEAKAGNKEFALWIEDAWCRAAIGNTSSWVMLGESSGEFIGEGETPEDACSKLLKSIQER